MAPAGAAHTAAADTVLERVELLMEAGELPNGDQIFDLVLEDQIAHYVWFCCIDWVLWRQAHGRPVNVCTDPDRTSAAIDARYEAAWALSSDRANWHTDMSDADVALLCAGEMIARWERTPEQEAELQEDSDLIKDTGDDPRARRLEGRNTPRRWPPPHHRRGPMDAWV